MPAPDEGLIHAWLDGQLPPDEATRVEQLVATDAEWAAAAAEARGVIAASSRILSALDRVPSGVVPQRTVAPVARRLPWWTKMAAAVVLVVGGSTLVMRRAPEPPPVTPLAMPARAGGAAKAPSATTSRATVRSLAEASSGQAASAAAIAPAAPPAAPTAAVASVGGVSNEQAKSTAAAADQTSRAQQLDQARQDAAQVMAQRTSVEMRREAPMSASARESAREVPAPLRLAARARLITGSCYELRENRTSAVVGVVMRGERTQGDTLFLTPARTPSPARAWVVTADGTVHGVLTTEPDGRGMVLVSALPVACPTP